MDVLFKMLDLLFPCWVSCCSSHRCSIH